VSKFDIAKFDVEDYTLRLSGMAAHLATLSEEVKDGEIVAKMLQKLPPRFKQIKTLLDAATMSVADLTGRLKEADEAFYLTEEEWDARRKKRKTENHSDDGIDKGRGREANRLYLLHIKLTQLACFTVRERDDEVAWCWHKCLEHINMAALQKLAQEELVRGLPEIGQVEQLCEACQIRKQRHTTFPVKTEYRARRRLLLVDDLSRYMWVAAIPSKDHATAVIKEIQAWVKGESDLSSPRGSFWSTA
jgi:hypothetical protein